MIEKLALSQRAGKLTLIQEGMFLRCYNQSLFSLVQHIYPELKVSGKSFKNCQGQVVFYGGFPKDALSSRLCGVEVRETEWGIEIDCDVINEEAYQTWRQNHLVSVENAVNSQRVNEVAKVNSKSIQLSDAEYRFLSEWEPGRFPDSVDKGFIQGIKHAWGFTSNEK